MINIGVIGLGLIGGSFALAAKKHFVDAVLFGRDKNTNHIKAVSYTHLTLPTKA